MRCYKGRVEDDFSPLADKFRPSGEVAGGESKWQPRCGSTAPRRRCRSHDDANKCEIRSAFIAWLLDYGASTHTVNW